ncbi:metal dependent phosphohydrolase [Candidatus Magnetobacterium bavaricum]|uniref:Metal dependent phosphohydrolase n=1 Tax=Candidatus Magnetobacterium bavaricum TaxID=29290 RepID=A0A0F3GT90_9BACT|nr:metal dependent phosphohydrolase [Candidatus Magnetobacterium bavaricum]
MRKRILTEELCIGMFIDGMDASWFKTPFLKHHFLIKTNEQIEKVKETGIEYVFIDPDKGADIVSKAPAISSRGVAATGSEGRAKGDSVLSERGLAATQEELFKDYVRMKEELLSIDNSSLFSGSMIDFSLYVKNGLAIKPLVQYKGREILLSDEMVSPVNELLIEKKDTPKFKGYIKCAIKGGVGGLNAQQIKNIAVKENAKIIVQELLSNPSDSEKVQECRSAVEGIMAAIMDSKGFITNLLTINKNDYYTYTHSVNISVFSVATAIASGVSSEEDLFGIGLGCLLHDIGKTTIPPEILNKSEERLTDFEIKLLREHVIEGANILKLYKGVPEWTLYPILEHHENIAGTGYPNSLVSDTMHFAGKITSLTNYYDMLTTSRPFFEALTPFEALSYIRNSSQEYDLNIFKEFIKILGKTQ